MEVTTESLDWSSWNSITCYPRLPSTSPLSRLRYECQLLLQVHFQLAGRIFIARILSLPTESFWQFSSAVPHSFRKRTTRFACCMTCVMERQTTTVTRNQQKNAVAADERLWVAIQEKRLDLARSLIERPSNAAADGD